MNYVLPRGYLSASSINLLLLCPKKFEFRYVKGVETPPGLDLCTGSITHKVFEDYYKDAMLSSTRLTGDQVKELALDEVIPGWYEENETSLSDQDKTQIAGYVPEAAKHYVNHIGHKIQPVASEQEIFSTMASGVPIKAYLDLEYKLETDDGIDTTDADAVDGSPESEKLAIADYKITGRAWDKKRLENALQFQLYTYLSGIYHVSIHNLIKGKGTALLKPQDGVTAYGSNLRTVTHSFDGTQVLYLEDLVRRCAELVTAGIFIPCSPDAWCCNETWCEYWDRCRGKKV